MVNRICSSYWLVAYAVWDWNRDHRNNSPMTKHYISETISARLSERLYFRSSAIRPHVFVLLVISKLLAKNVSLSKYVGHHTNFALTH
jgi:hypothetical protein